MTGRGLCPRAAGPDTAYTLDVVIADRPASELTTIAASAPGSVIVQSSAQVLRGWTGARMVADGEASLHWLEQRLHEKLGGHLIRCVDLTIERSRGGKTHTHVTEPVRDADDVAFVYGRGASRVAQQIATNPAAGAQLTGKPNRLAVVTDGSAVLGLGNLDPIAALTVIEGKAALLAQLATIDAVPICLDTHNVDDIVSTVLAIAPSFGAINLEGISAPRCFTVEAHLRDKLQIPVLNDEPHGTAIIVLAALHNALKVVEKRLETARIVVLGAGAAGTAVTSLLLAAGARDVIVWSSTGILHPQFVAALPSNKIFMALAGRPRVDETSQYAGSPTGVVGVPAHWLVTSQRRLAAVTNPREVRGGRLEALNQADAVIGVSTAGLLTRKLVRAMAPHPIVFTLANPVPEIDPTEIADIAEVIATRRSQDPNQVSSVLVFPGLFRTVLDEQKVQLDTTTLLACAHALTGLLTAPSAEKLLPGVLDKRVMPTVAAAIATTIPATDPRWSK